MNGYVKDGVLTLPREMPQEGMLILTRGANDGAALFTPGQWKAFEEKLNSLPPEKSRMMQRFFCGELFHAEVLDYQIEIPAFYRRFLKDGLVSLKLDERGYYALVQEDAE